MGRSVPKTHRMNALNTSLFLAALAFTPLAAQQLPSQSPYFHVSAEDEKASLEGFSLQGSHVKVNIAGVIADVTVSQTYVNDTEVTLDADYIFPGSTRAAVYAMQMRINERVIKAVVKEKEEAQAIFKEAVEAGKTASLLEQERPNVFRTSLGNIRPGDTVRVEFSYTEDIVPRNKEYAFVFPTIVGPRYGNLEHLAADPWIQNPYTEAAMPGQSGPSPSFALDLGLNAGLPVKQAACSSHPAVKLNYRDKASLDMHLDQSTYEANKGDVIFRYRLAGEAIDGGVLLYEEGGEQFFMMTMQPPERPTVDQIPPRDYLFIVDVSGSMNGFPIQVSKELMHDLLSSLRPVDRFNVLLFASGFAKFHREMVPVSSDAIRLAIRFIDQQPGSGGTELMPALEEALAMIDDAGRSTTVVIATDGLVTVEKQAMDLIQERLGQANFFPFGIGSSTNRYLLEALAHVGHSEPLVATNADEARRVAQEFRTMIASPVLTDVKLDFEGMEVYDVIPKSVPDLFADKPIVVYGKYRGRADGRVRVTGSNGAGRFDQSMPVAQANVSGDNAALRYLWARQKIRVLSDYNHFSGQPETRKQIVDLGLKYNLLTEFTSFVAVDNSRPADKGKSLQKSMHNTSGSVPEPHEWSLIALGVLLLVFLLFANKGAFHA